MVKKRQRKKNYNKWRDKTIQQIWARRPKKLTTKRELNQWMDDQVENEGLFNWSTYLGMIEAIRDMKAGRLQEFDSFEEFQASLDEDAD